MICIDHNSRVLVETERLVLRQAMISDEALFINLFCDEFIMKYLGGIWTEELTLSTLVEWINEWGKDNYYYGVLESKEAGKPVGIAGFTENTNPDEPGIELSWFILPEHQNKGYASEITKELISFVFGFLKKDRLFAETAPNNLAANKVLARLGFMKIGNKKNHYDYLPRMNEQVVWEFTGEKWKKTQKE